MKKSLRLICVLCALMLLFSMVAVFNSSAASAFEQIEAISANAVFPSANHEAGADLVAVTPEGIIPHWSNVRAGDYFKFESVDFGLAGALTANACGRQLSPSGTIKLYINGPDAVVGILIATINFSQSVGDKFDTHTVGLTQAITGVHDVYAVVDSSIEFAWFSFSSTFSGNFRIDGVDKTNAQLALDWVTPMAPAKPQVAGGDLQVSWVGKFEGAPYGSVVGTKLSFDNYILDTYVKGTLGVYNAIGIRQTDYTDYFSLKNDIDAFSGPNSQGITISLNDNYKANVMVIYVEKSGKGVYGARYVVDTNADFFTDYNKLTVEDKGNIIIIKAADKLVATIVLEGLTNGVYTTGSIYDKNGNQITGDSHGTPVTQFTGMQIPIKGKVAYCVRGCEMLVKSVDITAIEVSNMDKYGLRSFSIKGVQTDLADGTIAQTFSKEMDLSNVLINFETLIKQSKVFIGGIEVANNSVCSLEGNPKIEVKTQVDGNEVVVEYPLNLTLIETPKPQILKFYFKEYKGYEGVIRDGKISVSLPYDAEIDQLTAIYELDSNCVVTSGDAVQQSGVTVNSFVNKLTYKLEQSNFAKSTYEVEVLLLEKPKGGGGGGSKVPSNEEGKKPTTVGSFPSVPATPKVVEEEKVINFSDLGESYLWAKPSINKLLKLNIISGYADNTFKPNKNVSREEFTKMLLLTFKINANILDGDFVDVPKNSWFAPFVYTAKNLNIVNGFSPSKFGAGELITREDLCVLIDRALSYKNIKPGATDLIFKDEISDYAKQSVKNLHKLGVIKGKTETEFYALDHTTRAEVAVILDRILLVLEGGQQ